MHIFLQGPKGVGKSTAVQKAIALLSREKALSLSGFVTYKGSDARIYITAADREATPVSFAGFSENGAKACVRIFEREAVSLLENAGCADLICLDELGFLESKAHIFQRRVMECLDANIPVLGVLRDGDIPWHQPIKSHPSVILLRVGEENRDTLPVLIYEELYCDMILRR